MRRDPLLVFRLVFKQVALMPVAGRLSDNVGLGLEFRGVPKAERRHMVEAQLEMVRLVEWADKYPAELSGGMQQRVGLARAFATGSDILLMDERSSAVDPFDPQSPVVELSWMLLQRPC